MTSNADRAAILERALRAGLVGDRAVLAELVTDDVRAWTPLLSTASLDELVDALDRRDDAFSDLTVDIDPLDVAGDFACVEWTVEMTHSGTVTLPGDHAIEPTGERVTVHGISVAEFEGSRICSLRQYWDELAALEQIGAVAREA